ncbi:MAG TPA: hypothetical protein VFU46_14255 [Gemmatimonadales bacterium]|nr:hypothetical protein [Gemmatimonadales bacterium]
MTHTEKVHVIFGCAAAVTGALAVRHAYRPESRTRFVWPVIGFLIGFFLFVPVEAQSRTYEEVGWWETLASAVPQDPAGWVADWFARLDHRHVIQHKIAGFLIMAAGAIEWLRAQGRLAGKPWGQLLPLLLIGIGLAFGVHGGTRQHLPHYVEQLHHWLFGVGFVLAGVALALWQHGLVRAPTFRGLWAALVLIVGLDIAFFYRLDPGELRRAEGHHHEGAGPGLR